MSGKLLSVLAGLLLAAFSHCPSNARAEVHEAEFPEIVVSAAVEGAEAKKLPASVQVISRKELESAGVRSVEEALTHFVPGNSNSQPGAFSSAGLRGFRSGASASSVLGDRVVVLIDGLRTSSGNTSVIPFALVDRVEIVRGPASVLYGSSAMGGVVNIITRRGKGEMRGELGASYGRFDSARGYAALHGDLSDKWGMALGFGTSKMGEYKMGGGRAYENTHSSNADGGATLTYRNEGTELHLVGLHRSLYDTGSPGAAYSPSPQDRVGSHYSRVSGQLAHTTDQGHAFSAAFFGDKNIYRIVSADWMLPSLMKESRYTTYSAGLRTSASFSLGEWGRLSAGIDYANIREKMGGESVWQPDSRNDVFGLFGEYRFEAETFTLFSGLRYDRYDGTLKGNRGVAQRSVSKDFENLSWSAGGVFWLTDWLGIKTSAGTAFVAPTAVNMAGNYHDGYGRYVGNPELEAEKSFSAEGGFELAWNGFHAEVTYFQSWYEDRIASSYDIGLNANTWKNVDSQRLNGFDIELSWKGKAGVFEVSPYLHSEIFTKTENGDGSVVTNLPHHSTVAGLGLGLGKAWLDINARFTGSQVQKDFGAYPAQDADMSPYTIVNAKLTLHATERLDLYVGVNNLTDRYYAVTLGYPLPGRAVYGGFTYKF